MEEQKNQQGVNIPEEKIFEKIGRLVMINEQLGQMLFDHQKKLQEVVDENELLKSGGGNLSEN